MNDDYDLGKIFDEHFASLATTHNIQELMAKFPRIPIPQDPFEVVTDKMMSLLTRDFYEAYDEYDEVGDVISCDKLVSDTLNKIYEANAPIMGISPENAFLIFADSMVDRIIERHERIIEEDSYGSIPTHRKSDKASFSKDDIKLLPLNYDDYVTSVIKQIYVDKKRPNEVVYSNYGLTFDVGSLNDSVYKFDKIPEKIKVFIADAAKIQALQRNYDKFSNEELKSRLNYYSNKEFASDGVVFENIINFYNCNFNKEDVTYLKEFLRALDSVNDKKMTVEELVSKINSQELIPKGTEKLNTEEFEKLSQEYKAEQQLVAQLGWFY